MSEVLDLLGVTDRVARSAHAHFLNETVKSFSFARELNKCLPTLHQSVATVEKLKLQLRQVVESLKGIRPEIRVMIGSADPPFSPRDLDDIKDKIERLILTLGEPTKGSWKSKLPKRLPDGQMEQVIAFLMLRVRDITGELAHALSMDSRFGRPARLKGKEAEAIWMLLMHLPDVTESQSHCHNPARLPK